MRLESIERSYFLYRASYWNSFPNELQEKILDNMSAREAHYMLSLNTSSMSPTEARNIWMYYGNKYFEKQITSRTDFARACSELNPLVSRAIYIIIDFILTMAHHIVLVFDDDLSSDNKLYPIYNRLRTSWNISDPKVPLVYLGDNKEQLNDLVTKFCDLVWSKEYSEGYITLKDQQSEYAIPKLARMFGNVENLSTNELEHDSDEYKLLKLKISTSYPDTESINFISSIDDLVTAPETDIVISCMFLSEQWPDQIEISSNVFTDEDKDERLINKSNLQQVPWLPILGKLVMKYMDKQENYSFLLEIEDDTEEERQSRMQLFRDGDSETFRLTFLNEELCNTNFWAIVLTGNSGEENLPRFHFEDVVSINGEVLDFNLSIGRNLLLDWHERTQPHQ